jgi:hypothetical protein
MHESSGTWSNVPKGAARVYGVYARGEQGASRTRHFLQLGYTVHATDEPLGPWGAISLQMASRAPRT